MNEEEAVTEERVEEEGLFKANAVNEEEEAEAEEVVVGVRFVQS